MRSVRRYVRAVAIGVALASMQLASCPCGLASDVSLDISQYAHTAWKVRDGFAKGAVSSIAQTRDGYLWLGTQFGLLRFDGVRAMPWQPPDGEQLPSNYIRGLLVGRDGTLWIATQKGLASWKDGKLTNYPATAGQMTRSLLEDREGTIWVGSDSTGTLCAVDKGKEQCDHSGSFGQSVTALYEDAKGNLWVSSTTGLWRWKPGVPQHYPLDESPYVDAFIEDDSGNLLLATVRGLKLLVGRKIQNYALPGITGQFRPGRLFRSRDGNLWIGSQQGLLHLHQDKTDIFGPVDGLSGDYVTGIFEDREGSVWVSTMSGLDRFREYAVPRISRNQGLSASNAYSVRATGDGAIWIGTPSGLDRWANGRMALYGNQNGAQHRVEASAQKLSVDGAMTEAANAGLTEAPQSLGLDDQGRLLVSSVDGVSYFEGGRFKRVLGVGGGNIYAIAADGHGKVWISNANLGLFHVTPGSTVQLIPWSRFGYKGLGVAALLPDRFADGVWLGFFEGGVVYFRDGQVRASYTAGEGLGSGRVNDLRFGPEGTLWAATEGGLSRIKDGRAVTLSSKNGLPCDEVHWSIEDNDHFVWLLMPCGLVRVSQSELDAWASASGRKPQLTIFDNTDGVPSVGSYGGYGPHVTKSPDGKIWFVHNEGLSVIDPRHLPFNNLPPSVHIAQITADGKTYDASNGLRLPPHVRNLGIDYTALSLAVPERVHFRFKLEGQDEEWREATNNRRVEYSNLAPRNYRFRAAACNNSGLWNEEGAFLDFSIAPAYYQTNWFRVLCVGAFLALAWALYQFRLHQIQRQFNISFEARVNERLRIARELHDTLLQSLHGLLFRFQAARNMLPRRPEEATEALDTAIARTEQAIAESQDAIRDLRPAARGDLEELMRAVGEELESSVIYNGARPTFEVIVEGERKALSPTLQAEVYRIACEILRNAFRHACARRIEAEVRYADEQLRVRIRDDGKGIDQEVLKKGSRQGHWGLPGVKERAYQIGAQLDFWSQAGAGTEVQLSIPAAIAYRDSQTRPRVKFFRRW